MLFYFILAKLRIGVDRERIIDDLPFENGHDSNIFADKQLLANIAARHKIPIPGKFNSDDCASAKTALDLLRERFKDDKEKWCVYGDFPNDRVEDAFIVIIPPLQSELLKKHAGGTVGIDTTFDMTRHKHHLTTIIIQNERKRGVPVAYCISKRRDTATWKRFFEVVFESLGTISCGVFLSDGDPTYFTAWSDVMGRPARKRLCIWHVKKSWGRKLYSLKFTKQEEADMMSILSAMIEESDQAK